MSTPPKNRVGTFVEGAVNHFEVSSNAKGSDLANAASFANNM